MLTDLESQRDGAGLARETADQSSGDPAAIASTAATPTTIRKDPPVAVVIMAGGVGTRLFPASTISHPKQFIRWPTPQNSDSSSDNGQGLMAGETSSGEHRPDGSVGSRGDRHSLIQQTYQRLLPIADPGCMYVATTIELAPLVREHLPELPVDNLIMEPLRRNSAGACALATAIVAAIHGPEVVVLLVPSDGWISGNESYQATLRQAAAIARDQPGIVVVGIQPHRPATGYGYIRPGMSLAPGAFIVKSFEEKPDDTRARQLLVEGCFWNAGIYVWRAATALQAFQQYLPHHARLFEPDLSVSEREGIFVELPVVSIDVGVAERAENVYCVAGQFPWDDLGAWDAFSRVLPPDNLGNTSLGGAHFQDAWRCIAVADEGRIVALGVSDLVIVRYGETVLVCPRDRAQEVGKLGESLTKEGRGTRDEG